MRARDDGTVLLSTLLMLSLMSAVALGLLATLRLSVAKAQQLGDTAQADLYAQGAESFAAVQLEPLAALDGPARNAALLQAEPVVLPFEGGSITAVIRDGTHCLRLSALAGDGVDTAQMRLRNLLGVLGLPPGEASGLAATAADWVDEDTATRPGGAEDGTYLFRELPHRTANTALSSVAELRALDGMTEATFQTLRPHVCIGRAGTATRFNVDTMDATHLPVLQALIAGENVPPSLARDILERRPASGYGAAETLGSVLGEDALQGADLSALAFAPDRVEVEAVVRFGTVERARLFGFEGLDGGPVELTYRDWGRASFRPVVEADGEEP